MTALVEVVVTKVHVYTTPMTVNRAEVEKHVQTELAAQVNDEDPDDNKLSRTTLPQLKVPAVESPRPN